MRLEIRSAGLLAKPDFRTKARRGSETGARITNRERVVEDRFGREKENNRHGHNCNFMKQDDLPLKLS